MFYLGIDQHRKQLTVNLRNEQGEIVLVQPEKRAKQKTDRRDASNLAELLWVNRHRLLAWDGETARLEEPVVACARALLPDGRLLVAPGGELNRAKEHRIRVLHTPFRSAD